MGKKGFIYKRKEGIGSVGSDQGNVRPLRGGWAKTVGMKIPQLVWNELHCLEGKTDKRQPV